MPTASDIQMVAGQPVKFRYSGHTEIGARGNKALFGIITAKEWLSGLLRDDPAGFIKTYRGRSEGVNGFLRATIGNWSENGEFDDWYRGASPEVIAFLRELGLTIIQMCGLHCVAGTHAFSGLPADLPLPEQVRRQIEENSRRIDEDRGAKGFTYGVMSVCNNGYKEAIHFGLGVWHSWAAFGELALTDPNYAREIVPITTIDLLAGLQGVIDSYAPSIAKGGLDGAMEARKQFLLQRVYEKLERTSSPGEVLQVMKGDNRVPAPETGIYVLRPSGSGEPFAVRADPRYDEDVIAGMMGVLTSDKRGFDTLRFQALEVPERALDYVTERRNLEVRLS